MTQRLMLLPSLACPAGCLYCFGPHQCGSPMGRETVEAVINWGNTLDDSEPLEITFHGGEPLVVGARFYRMALPLLRSGLAPREVRFTLQSNLWLLSEELCEIFHEFGVSLGTSLDGPETINDAQRGQGYFKRTMAGIERARLQGLDAGCICTFTPHSAAQAEEIFTFFVKEGIDFSIHAALPSLGKASNGWNLPAPAHGQLLVDMLERYLANIDKVHISTLDALCRSVSLGQGGICTFSDCLGEYLAVDPQGWIYACQRLAGMPEYRLGNVHEHPSLDELAGAPVWRMFQERQERIEQECGGCPHLDYCRGGCPYNVLTANDGSFERTLRDPQCPAYQRIFDHITERALEEVFSDENLSAVVEVGPGKHGLMHEGRLLRLMRGGAHPHEVAGGARELVAAVALAVSESPRRALAKLDQAGLITQPVRALESLALLRNKLDNKAGQGLVNAYIHVTNACNLSCSHCYAQASPGPSTDMGVGDLEQLVRKTAGAGFRKAVITGGEPLVHPQREALLEALAAIRRQVKPMQTVLRTNLAGPLAAELVERLAHSTDQLVVSVDGDETSHNARRGAGTYQGTLANLRTLLSANPTTEVCLTGVLTAAQMDGAEGEAVRRLGTELGVQMRLKPVLPLGRGANLGLAAAHYSSFDDMTEQLANGRHIEATCGLGMNLYVGPDGACYPCYALTAARHRLGNVLLEGLEGVLQRNNAYRQYTVDSNQKCRTCAVRYVCGGHCRAWGAGTDPNAPPLDCSTLYAESVQLLIGALEVLNVPLERWVDAGLPRLDTLPRAIEGIR